VGPPFVAGRHHQGHVILGSAPFGLRRSLRNNPALV
jgi:hypothetical protein